MMFEELAVGTSFRVRGKITGKPSVYLWEKIEDIVGSDGVTYNAKTLVGMNKKQKTVKYGSMWPDDEVIVEA